MYLPHKWEGRNFVPIAESAVLSDVLVPIAERRLDTESRKLDIWDRRFMQAQEILAGVKEGARPASEETKIFEFLLRMLITRDERLIPLARKHLDLEAILAIRRRMIGSGLIGGKSAGMLLARAILCASRPDWRAKLETHDSFFIGSDVFYSFLVRNGCWHIRRNQRNPSSFLEGAEVAQARILNGTFPPSIQEQFVGMLEYFGQSPIIVRSSSLLEDSFGNAFTGKYESLFCPNQGSPEERLTAFLTAVRTVYASTMSREALLYRAHRGLLDSDEQMAILVQRVSGAVYGHLFYPQVAGVALSYNPYVWSKQIDPEAGVLRLVFGLGTRAVDRSDDDYTRVIALNEPLRRPEATFEAQAEYSQHRVDVLNLESNRLESRHSDEVIGLSPGVPIDLFATWHRPERGEEKPRGAAGGLWLLNFDRLLSATSFVDDMRAMLGALKSAYNYPVDVEFTANFLSTGSYRINLVQCRPLQVKEGGSILEPPEELKTEDTVLEAGGAVVGQSSFSSMDRVVFVRPSAYGALSIADRFSVARTIGRLTRLAMVEGQRRVLLLVGPGRWGTSTPSLGVPVSFAEINAVSVLCELVMDDENVIPDISLGTHFFNDLVEANMLYLAVYPSRPGNRLDESFFTATPDLLAELLPDDKRWANVIYVRDLPCEDGRGVYVNANCLTQRAVCYLARPGESRRQEPAGDSEGSAAPER
jgi:hypothetical protein